MVNISFISRVYDDYINILPFSETFWPLKNFNLYVDGYLDD